MKKFSVVLVLLFSLIFLSFSFSSQAEASTSSSQLIIINKKINTLAFYDKGKLVKTFKVATGKLRGYTPEGTFKIVKKIVNRPYYKGKIPGGDPRNPLGNRWMGLNARGTYGTTYGIHGNNNESSIGKYASHGCIRMHNAEVRWLYPRVKLYTPVYITYSSKSFNTLAKEKGYHVNGWVVTGAKHYYYVNGTMKKGWQTISGKRYYFDSHGVMKTSWQTISGKHYYFDSHGVMKTGWQTISSKRYYFDSHGVMKTGWQTISGKHYYFDSHGVMKTGWQTISSKRYYFDSHGVMKTGWQTISSKRYYFDSHGIMKTGWQTISSKRYYFDSHGVMKTGWQTISGKRYYFDGSGVMKTGWQTISSKRYYFDGSGVMKTGWQTISGKRYYFDGSGVMKTGWQTISGKRYYFDGSGVMKTGWQIISGQKYYFGSDGVLSVDYVALGDSLAAGMTPDGVDNPVVNGKDPNWGYPNYLAEDFANSYKLIKFVNYGVSGYKADDVIAQLAQSDVQNEIKQATHLTIDIGANDLLQALPQKAGDPVDQEKVQLGIINVKDRLNTILSKIDALNPNVKVYVMGYYNPFPYYPAELQAQLVSLLTVLNGAIQQDAVANGDTFVPTDTVIAGDYQKYITNPQNIHLSLDGYKVVAGEFWKTIQK